MLSINNLNFCYITDFYIYKDASLNINECGLYYFDASNGAGKTTLFKIIKREIKTKAEILVDGSSNPNLITLIDYNSLIEKSLTVYEQLHLFCSDESFINYLLTDFNLTHLKDKYPAKLSRGERAKVAFILGILEQNKVILIDEIFTHLDDDSIAKIALYCNKLKKDHIIIYSSHKYISYFNPDYIIKIENFSFKLVKNDISSQEEGSLIFPEYKINNKLLKKALNRPLLYLISILVSLSIIVFSFCFNYMQLDRVKLTKFYCEESKTKPYFVSSLITDEDVTSMVDIIFGSLKNNLPRYKGYKDVKSNYIQTRYDITGDYNYPLPFSFNLIFIVDDILDEKLEEGEIVITDYAYRFLNYGYDKPINTLELYGHEFTIKAVIQTDFTTNYLKYFNQPEDIPEKMGPYDDFDAFRVDLKHDPNFVFNLNYIYKNIYMNQETYNNFLAYRKEYFLNSYKLYENKVLTIGYDSSLDEDSVYINPNTFGNVKIGDYLYASLTIYQKEYNELYLTPESLVDGYTLDFDIVYKDEESMLKTLLDDYDRFVVETYSVNNDLSLDDIPFLLNIPSYLIFDNYLAYKTNLSSLSHIKLVNSIIFWGGIFILVIFVSLYIYFDKKNKSPDIRLLKSKNICYKRIRKIIFLNYFKAILISLVLVVAIILIVHFKGGYEELIKYSLGII